MLSLNDNEIKNLEIIKKNYSSFGQLKILAEQISNLQNKAQEIIHEAQINDYLHNIEMQTKKVPYIRSLLLEIGLRSVKIY